MDPEKLVELGPKFHDDGQGSTISWGLSPDVLQYLAETVESGQSTLETGAGMSTVIFLASGARHTAISPAPSEFERVRAFCRDQGVPTEFFEEIVGNSEIEVPKLQAESFDVLLIDGRHAFPSPFIDWYYGALALRTGGLVLVDDTHLWSGDLLCNFLRLDDRWEVVREMPKTSVYRKLHPRIHDGDWNTQPYFMELQRRLEEGNAAGST